MASPKRLRKRQRKLLGPSSSPPSSSTPWDPMECTCDQCGVVIRGEDHNSAYSRSNITWDGVVIVAWCPNCGWEYAS